MSRLSIAIIIGVFLVIGFVISVQRVVSRPVVETSVNQLFVNPTSIDFGDIDQGGGIVSQTVTVTNYGSKPLEIYRISTSCGCTTAEMDQSPIEPNVQRLLTISFDPMAHPDQNGTIARVVYLQTSDPNQPEFEINVIGNVIAVK
ncbi:MAG: DUF1573 domain-containing protein [Patescibacteria group bacterium]